MSGKLRNLLMMLLTVIVLGGCTSSGSLTIKQDLVEPIDNQKVVSIWVKSDKVPQGEKHDATKACSSLQEKLYARLVSEGIFKSSVIYPNTGDYSLEVDVVGVRLVSPASRILWGVMAGASGIEANVLLRDKAGNVLTEFHADGSSATHPLSSESGADNAISELATKITQGIRQK